VRHFKTDPTDTVALCFGYPKTPLHVFYNWLDEEGIGSLKVYTQCIVGSKNKVLWGV
jgi:hypothetical protein